MLHAYPLQVSGCLRIELSRCQQESTLEAGRERDEALAQAELQRAQLQAVSQSQERMAQQLDALGQELAATRQQLQESQVLQPLRHDLSVDVALHRAPCCCWHGSCWEFRLSFPRGCRKNALV